MLISSESTITTPKIVTQNHPLLATSTNRFIEIFPDNSTSSSSSSHSSVSQQLSKSSQELWDGYQTALSVLNPAVPKTAMYRPHIAAIVDYANALLREEASLEAIEVIQSALTNTRLQCDDDQRFAEIWVRSTITSMDSFESGLKLFIKACELKIPLHLTPHTDLECYCKRLCMLGKRSVMTEETVVLFERFLSRRDIAVACRDEMTALLVQYYDDFDDGEIQKKFAFLVNHASVTPLRAYLVPQIRKQLAEGKIWFAMNLLSAAMRLNPPIASKEDIAALIDILAASVQRTSRPYLKDLFQSFQRDPNVSGYLLNVCILRLQEGRYDEAVEWLDLISNKATHDEGAWSQVFSCLLERSLPHLAQIFARPTIYRSIPATILENQISKLLKNGQQTTLFLRHCLNGAIQDKSFLYSLLIIFAKHHQSVTKVAVSASIEQYVNFGGLDSGKIPRLLNEYFARAFEICNGGAFLYELLDKLKPCLPLILVDEALSIGGLPSSVENALMLVTNVDRLQRLPGWDDSVSLLTTANEMFFDSIPPNYRQIISEVALQDTRRNRRRGISTKQITPKRQEKPIFSIFLRYLELLLAQRPKGLEPFLDQRHLALREIRKGFKGYFQMSPKDQQRFMRLLGQYFVLNWNCITEPLHNLWSEAYKAGLFERNEITGAVLCLIANLAFPVRDNNPYSTDERLSFYREAINLAAQADTYLSLVKAFELSILRLTDIKLNLFDDIEMLVVAYDYMRLVIDMSEEGVRKSLLHQNTNRLFKSFVARLVAGNYDHDPQRYFTHLQRMFPLFAETYHCGTPAKGVLDLLKKGKERWPNSTDITGFISGTLTTWVRMLKSRTNAPTSVKAVSFESSSNSSSSSAASSLS